MISTNWKRNLGRLGIWVLFFFVICYQLRSSIDAIQRARHLDFWLPFSVEPFSDRIQNLSSGIESAGPIAETIPVNPVSRKAPLHLLAVNHRQFRGMSVYLTQLWNHHPTIGVDPTLRLSMRYGDSRSFTAHFLVPHCTCGTNTVWELVQLFLLPPLFCVVLAFFMLLRQPGVLRIWGMSALLLAISQLDLLPHGAGFQWTGSNTMAWTDWFRIPATAYRAFAQNVWPAALIVLAAHLFRVKPAVWRYSRWVTALLLGWCVVQSLLAVSWSEYYLPFVPLYGSLQQHSEELTAATLLLVAALCFMHSRTMGSLVFALALAASSVPYWPTPSIAAEHKMVASVTGPSSWLQVRQLIPVIPRPIVSSGAIVPAFVAAAVLLLLAFEWRRTKRLVSVSLLLLLLPALYLLGVLSHGIDIGLSWSLLMFVLLCAGGGLLGISMHCLSPSHPE